MKKWNKCKMIVKSAYMKSKRGIKGSISLFLALIVTPLLGLTCLLVESIRYQDVMEEINEISDLSALSTIANYDKFLKDRYGLFAVSQKNDVNDLYSNYFQKNSQLIANDFTLASTDVSGEYSLAEIEVLKQQILEYSEVCSAIEIALNGINFEDLFSQLFDAIDLDFISKAAEGLDASANICEATAEIVKDIKTIVDNTGDNGSYTKAKAAYDEAYADFKSGLEDYISALNDCDADDIYNDSSVVDAWDDFTKDEFMNDSVRTKYADAIGDLANESKTLVDTALDIVEQANTIIEEANNLQDATSGDGAVSTKFDLVLDIAMCLVPVVEFAEDQFDEVFRNTSQNMNAMKTRVKNELKKDTYNHDTVYSESLAEDWHVEIPTGLAGLGQTMLDCYDQMNQYITGQGMNAFSNALTSFVTTIFNFQGACDANLCAQVGEEFVTPEFDVSQISTCAGTIAIASIVDGINSLNNPLDLIDFLLALPKLLFGISMLLLAIVAWARVFEANLLLLVVDGFTGDLDDKFLLAGYAAYNFPNRTNYRKEKITFTDYPYYNDIYRDVMDGNATEASLGYSIDQLSGLLEQVLFDPGDDPTFYGAEAEYLLCGWADERLNQCGAFYNIYMLRMLCDFGWILASPDVASLASDAGEFFWVVYILIVIVDPLLDTLILVNGGSSHLIKTYVYCTEPGIEYLIHDVLELPTLQTLVSELEGITGGSLGFSDAVSEGLGFFRCSYTEHLWLLFFLMTNYETLLARTQNMICWESTAYYDYHGEEYDFENTYTYVHSTVTYTINPMFDFSSMTGNGVANPTLKTERYLGY
jgi:hypothetical protein